MTSTLVEYTYIDKGTGLPLSQEPAKTGPSVPEGVSPIFFVEDSIPTGVPIIFGEIDSSCLLPWMREVSGEEFLALYKEELKTRSRNKCKELLGQGVEFRDNLFAPTSASHLRSLLKWVQDTGATHIVYEVEPFVYQEWNEEDISSLINLLHSFEQKCFSWSKKMFERIDCLSLSCNYLEEASNISSDIISFEG